MKNRFSRDELTQTASLLAAAVRLVWTSARASTLVTMALVIFLGLLPLVSLLLLKQIVDAVDAALTRQGSFNQVLFWVVAAAAVALVTSFARSLSDLAAETQSTSVTDHVSRILHAQSIAADLEYYEDPRYHDTLHRAQQDAAYRPTRIVNALVQVGQNSLSLAGILALLVSFNWLIGLLLFLAAFPSALARLLHAHRLFQLEESQTPNERKAWYYHWLITSLVNAVEIRLLDVGGLFANRSDDIRSQVSARRLKLARSRVVTDMLAQVVTTAAVFAALAFICYRTSAGAVTVGALVMYYQGFQSGLSSLQGVLRSLAGLYEDSLFLTNFNRFLEIEPRIKSPARAVAASPRVCEGIRFEKVSFHYPGSDQLVLADLDLQIPAGKIVALVGENGAGKSTLIKLLARLYDPVKGAVKVDGVDLRELDPVDWRRMLSVIPQNFGRYHLSARENIWIGDVSLPTDSARVFEAAASAGADRVIERLAKKYDTQLGREFDSGADISAGEWQKLALARALVRDSAVAVLDEPTSSLDPDSEFALFERLRRLVRGRTAILISHRFSTVRAADFVVVMEAGRITEQGSHQELLALDGRYARLYRQQSQFYRHDSSPAN